MEEFNILTIVDKMTNFFMLIFFEQLIIVKFDIEWGKEN